MLQAVEEGRETADALLPHLYCELRALATASLRRESPGQTIQATALVHEAYLNLVSSPEKNTQSVWNSRSHFFGAAAEAMRRILVDRARAKTASKRGGGYRRIDLDRIDHPAVDRPEELLQLHEALNELEAIDAQHGELVKLRFFAGMTTSEAAELLQISVSAAERSWAYSRAWLRAHLAE